jgi:hypothetical protein
METVTLFSSHSRSLVLRLGDEAVTIPPHAPTQIPRSFWDAWCAQHADSPLLSSGTLTVTAYNC